MANSLTDRQRNALLESIAHWEDNLRLVQEEFEPDTSSADCALCSEFYATGGESTCSGCPVYEHTGEISCWGTPYHRVIRAMYRAIMPLGGDGSWADVEEAVVAELNFLKSLLGE